MQCWQKASSDSRCLMMVNAASLMKKNQMDFPDIPTRVNRRQIDRYVRLPRSLTYFHLPG